MTGLNLTQVKEFIIRPTLALFPPQYNSPVAVNLLAGTLVAESEGEYVHQLGAGPAIGLFEMEPATHDDCWINFLNYPGQAELAAIVRATALAGSLISGAAQMAGNDYYGCAMARVRYIRVKAAMPDATDAAGLCTYWKTWYNTAGEAGAVDSAHIAMFEGAIAA
jgi:hypothetical protein